VILVERRVHRRDDALAERVLERVVDGRREDAEARRDLAIDRDVEQGPGALLVGGDIGDARKRVVLEVEPKFQFGPEALSNIYVNSSTGQQVPLRTLVNTAVKVAPLVVNH
jgi:hypothetical protein